MQLSETKESAYASAASAQSQKLHCFELLKEFDKKNSSLIKHEQCVIRMEEQLDTLKKDLMVKESSQKQGIRMAV